jgi:hypothetical protein
MKMKKCPPGVICVENFSMVIIVIFMIIIIYLVYANIFKQNIHITNQASEKVVVNQERENGRSLLIPNYPYNNFPENVLLNPLVPPLSDERYFVRAVPINVPTNIGAVETEYRQLGILTPVNGKSKDNILPLMGRPLFVRRSLWNYYTISNQHNNVKLPILVKGRSALSENGVDQLYDRDTVYIEGANEAYKVTIYDNSTIRYIPYL